MSIQPAPFYTLEALASASGLSVAYLRRCIKSGALAAKKTGTGGRSKFLVSAEDAADWYRRQADAEVWA